jgi:phosphate transport system substrate-binding protein
MSIKRRALPAVAALAIAVFASTGASAGVLRVGGTGGAIGAMKQIAPSFAAATGIEMKVLPSLGSGGALRAVADGAIDVAVAARELTAEETGSGLEATPFARTALVFVTSKPKPNGWSSVDLARIFKSEIKKWKDGTPINIILRTKSDTDTELMSNIFPRMQEAIAQARARPDVPVASTDQDSAELAEGLPGSFVQSGLSQIVIEKRKLHLVPIDGVEPSLSSLENGTYPYEKLFYLAFKSGNHNANALLKFLHSPKGQEVLRATGNLPVVE